MNDLVWLKKESWQHLQDLLKNIQLRHNPAIARAAVHYTGTGSNSRIFLDIPEKLCRYDGMFKVIQKEEDRVTIFDPFDPEGVSAGYAYINGEYKEILSERVFLDEEKLSDNTMLLPDGTCIEVKEGYISLALDPEGKTFFALTPELRKRIYTGEFAVEYNHKEDKIVIVDGSD
ncbi:MAG: hypothetical protein IKA79_01930, partial [Lentisphaeria bacterium]|nr:hypothetical protein [Lentisphaeria bacterium]